MVETDEDTRRPPGLVGSRPVRRSTAAAAAVTRATNHPWVASLTAALAALAFVAGRLADAAHGSIGVFVVAGSRYARPGAVPTGIPVVTGNGYDGQFYFRMALDPADVARTAFGITFDSAERLSRLGYPFLAWLAAGGVRAAVPWTMVAVNVVALAVLGLLGAVLARSAGRHALAGLLVAAYPGFLWTLGRDTTELVAGAFLVGGLVALRASRPLVAGVLLAGSALSRETALATVGAVGVAWLVGLVARRAGHAQATTGNQTEGGQSRWPWLGPVDVAAVSWVLPVVAFVADQAVAAVRTGKLPLRSSESKNLALPFDGFVHGLVHYATTLPSTAALLWFGELAVLAVVVAMAATAARRSDAPLHERVAWAVLVVMAVCLAPGIWLGDVGFRSLDPLYLLSVVLLLGSPRRLAVPGSLVAAAWVVVAVELCLFV
ncbi:MAG: hypothetical protein ACP5P9_02190 [Acidimicrobiales bacterium]